MSTFATKKLSVFYSHIHAFDWSLFFTCTYLLTTGILEIDLLFTKNIIYKFQRQQPPLRQNLANKIKTHRLTGVVNIKPDRDIIYTIETAYFWIYSQQPNEARVHNRLLPYNRKYGRREA